MNGVFPFDRRAKARAETARPTDDLASEDFAARRQAMVEQTIVGRGVKDERVIAAMCRVPRHEFVPESQREFAYEDRPLPIGWEQTISQPYVVAFMTEALRLRARARVLEVGTGSGYQTAVLAQIAGEVFTLEIVPELAGRAAERFPHGKVSCACRDGAGGWPEAAPFDGILVAAAALRIPDALREQLRMGGRLVMPVGGRGAQVLTVVTRECNGFREEQVMPVSFVPMTGQMQASM